MTEHFNARIIECPACHAPEGLKPAPDARLCPACGATYEVRNGIPILLVDTTMATQLEHIDYDDHHNIDDERRKKVAADWKLIFDEHKVAYGDVLEIGSGTGQLTWGLAKELPFHSIAACDISYKFLDGIRTGIFQQDLPHVGYYACDANNLPFKSGSFDVVVGHSVLHHFVDYDKCLETVHRLLRKKGKAIFYEPVLQGKAWVAFFAELMLRIEKRTNWGVLNEEDVKKIEHMIRHILKAKWIGNNRERLLKVEDKHVFDIHAMEALAKKIGFSSCAHSNFYEADWGYKSHWAQHLLMAGIDSKKIQQFVFISNAFGHVFSDMMPKDVATPMGYFVFTK